jgi:sugar diacid utilization regulator
MEHKLVSVEEILAIEPLVSFKIIGGWAGRNNYITGIVNSIGDNRKLKQKLFVVECNGLSNIEVEEKIAKVLKKAAAAIFLIGNNEPSISKKIANINANKVPLIYLDNANNVELIRETYDYIKSLKEAGAFHKFIQSSNTYLVNMINNKGITAVVEYLQAALANPVLIANPMLEPIKIEDYKGEEWKEALKTIKHLLQSKTIEPDYSGTEANLDIEKIRINSNGEHNDEGTVFYLKKLRAGNNNYGFLILKVKDEELNRLGLNLFNKAAPPIISELSKYKEILETEKKYKENFIYDLLHNNIESQQAIIKQGKNWGWNLAKPHQLLIIDFNKFKNNQLKGGFLEDIMHIINETLKLLLKSPIITELNGQIIVIIPDPEEKSRKERKEYIKSIACKLRDKVIAAHKDGYLSLGIGRFYPYSADLCRSFQEAKTALELGKFIKEDTKITHFEDLGVMRLLASIRHEQLDDFYQEYLGELIAFDEQNKTSLLDALQKYFTENGDLKATASKLYVHPNTLRYRLKKIEEILGVDLQKSEDFLNILIALKVINMRSHEVDNFEPVS